MKSAFIFNNKSKNNNNNNEKGMALIATLIFVFVLTSIGIALLAMANNDTKLSTLQRESNRAFYLAEKGVEEALWFMNFSPDNQEGINWRVPKDDPDGPFTKGTNTEYFEVYVITEATDDEGDVTEIKFESTGIVDNPGEYNDARRTIEVRLQKGTIQNNSLAYNYAILADNFVYIGGTSATVNGDIHSNGNVKISGNFEPTNGTISATGTISGYEGGISNQATQPIPVVDFDYYYNKAVESGTVHNGDVILDRDTVWEGFHYIKGNLTIKPPASEIIIRNGAIFVDDIPETDEVEGVTFNGNTTFKIEHSDDWDNPLALVAKGDIDFGGTVEGEGVIQSESSIVFHGDVILDPGAVVAPEVETHGGIDIIYDDGLQEEVVVGTGIEVWKKVSWQEK